MLDSLFKNGVDSLWIPSVLLFGAASALIAAVHPYVTYPLSLIFIKAIRPRPLRSGINPLRHTYSILFCAFNESVVIRAKVTNLLMIKDENNEHDVDIIAYSDGSTDGTQEILSEYSGQIRVFGDAVRRGKSAGMNTLVQQSNAEILIFTDANVLLDQGVLKAFDRVFADQSVGAACGHLVYTNNDSSTAAVGTSYWHLEESIKQLESDSGSTPGADGSLFAIRRALYRSVPDDIIDDFYTSMQILCAGHRVVRCHDAVAFERSVTNVTQENSRKTRIACRAFNCHRLLKPGISRLGLLDKYKYYSHKWIRWMTFTWLCMFVMLALLGLSALKGAATAGLVFAGIVGLTTVAYASYAMNVPGVSKVWVVIANISAAQLGIFHSLQGRRYQTWKPSESARSQVAR